MGMDLEYVAMVDLTEFIDVGQVGRDSVLNIEACIFKRCQKFE